MDRRKVFANIYSSGTWRRGESFSGAGSDPAAAALYVAAVEALLETVRPATVLDIGHGDWVMWPADAFAGTRYIGIDVADGLSVAVAQERGNPNRTFLHLDAVTDDLPPADLVLVKEVLQHLSDADVDAVLRQLQSYEYVLVCSDVRPSGWRRLKSRQALSNVLRGRLRRAFLQLREAATHGGENSDIPSGGYRPLNLEKRPWDLRGYGLQVVRSWSLPHELWSQVGLERRVLLLRPHPTNRRR